MQMMSELEQIKRAMASGKHTDGDLQWCVERIEELEAEIRVCRSACEGFHAENKRLHKMMETTDQLCRERLKEYGDESKRLREKLNNQANHGYWPSGAEIMPADKEWLRGGR